VNDPDGNGVEAYLDTRAENDQQTWQGVNERFDPMAL
jgi:catechol 2,3-dioxygenase